MGTEKRARQKAGRQARIEAAQAAQRRQATRTRIIQIVVAIGFGALVIGAGVVLTNRDSDAGVDAGATSTTTPGATLPAKTITGDTPCPPADGSAERTVKFEKEPPMCIDPAKTYTAKVSTTKGDITMQLDPKSAPLAANNFVVLARYHYYDGVVFHRVIPGFVVQGGDATGEPAGTGDPGYKFKDELPADASVYKPGTLAMANSGPNSNGSQFFIILAEGRLGPQYSVFGQVTEGFDQTVKAIEAGGSPEGTPIDPALIKSITITES